MLIHVSHMGGGRGARGKEAEITGNKHRHSSLYLEVLNALSPYSVKE